MNQGPGPGGGASCCGWTFRPALTGELDSVGVKDLKRPMEPVVPADKNIPVSDSVSTCSVVPSDNMIVVLAITPYQLVRLLTAPITLSDSIKMTAMVDSGTMGNFIHPRFVEEHK